MNAHSQVQVESQVQTELKVNIQYISDTGTDNDRIIVVIFELIQFNSSDQSHRLITRRTIIKAK